MPPSGRFSEQGIFASEAPLGTQERQFGNPNLPIAAHLPYIEQAVRENPILIIQSETGSGKSTQIPQMLLEMDVFESIDHTQPRIIAAREIASRVDYELAKSLDIVHAGHLVGCKTSEDDPIDSEAILTIMTDGIMSNRAQAGYYDEGPRAAILDEIHEQNRDQETNLALIKDAHRRNPQLRTLILSATMDTQRLAEYFTNPRTGEPAPIVKLEGSNHKVEECDETDAWDSAFYYGKQGLDTLVFVDGKDAISKSISELHRRFARFARQTNNGMQGPPEILGLHSDMPVSKQARALRQYPNGKIVIATNIAQTSLTIPGLKVVIDTGVERRIEMIEGVPVLTLQPTSLASSIQRRGRVGRDGDGIYVRAPITKLQEEHPNAHIDRLYDVPEISRVPLDTLALRMALSKDRINMESLYNQPDQEQLNRAEQRLRRIGAIALQSGEATDIGRQLLELPLDTQYARMVLEAERSLQHASNEAERSQAARVLVQTAALASVQQVRGIVARQPDASKRWQSLTKEAMSDALQELEVFASVTNDRYQSWTDENFESIGVMSKRLTKARTIFADICERKDIDPLLLSKPTHHERRELVRNIITGTGEEIFIYNELDNSYQQERLTGFRLPPESTIRYGAKLIVGHAIGIEQVSPAGERRVNFRIVGGTPVGPGELFSAGNATERITTEHIAYEIQLDGSTAERQRVLYDGRAIDHDVVQPVTEPSAKLREFLIEQAFEIDPRTGQPHSPHVHEIVQQLQDLQHRVSESLHIEDRLEALRRQLDKKLPLYVINFSAHTEAWEAADISDAIKPSTMHEIYQKRPDTIHTYSGDDHAEFSEYHLTYRGGKAHVKVTPAQEEAVRDRLEDLGITDYEITLIRMDKQKHSWNKSRRSSRKSQQTYPGDAPIHSQPSYQRRKR